MKERVKKLLKIFFQLVFVVGIITALFIYFQKDAIEAAWYDDSYNFRQLVEFTHNAAINDLRAITFSLDTQELIADGVMQADCDDVRFTDINGKELMYELTGACDDSATAFEVVVEKVLNGTNQFFVYYGNESATSRSQDTSGFTGLTPSGGDPAITGRTNEETSPTPVVYLKFDETHPATQTDDATRFDNDATINGATFQQDEFCIYRSCLFLDGSDDVVTIANNTSIDFDDNLSSGFTAQVWVRPNSDGENSTGELFAKGNLFYTRIDNEGSDGLADLEVFLDLTTTDAVVNIADVININQWHLITITYSDDADDDLDVYIDGVLVATADGSGSITSGDASDFLIGGSTSNNLHGFIDEFKLYPYARTAEAIKTDFQKISSMHGTSASFGNRSLIFLSNGLTGYWKLDESSGNATDYSGAGLTLTNNNTTTFTTGKYYKGSEHVPASSQYFSTATQINNIYSFSFWTNPDTDTNYYLSLTSGASISSSSGTINTTGFTNPKIFVNGVESSTITANEWQLVTVVNDTPIDANQFYIGRVGSNYYDGTMDNVRLFNRKLTQTDANEIYLWSPNPVAFYPLDENTGTDVFDHSGNQNDSSVFSGAVWTPKGYFGSALSFDGNDDVVRFPDATSIDLGAATDSYSVSLWVKTSANTTGEQTLIAKNDGSGAYPFRIYLDSQERVNATIFDGTNTVTVNVNNSINTDNWHHIALVRDKFSSTVRLYINGALRDTDTDTTGNASNNDDVSIGADGTSYLANDYTGLIDQVQIYNYALDDMQVNTIKSRYDQNTLIFPIPSHHFRFDLGYGQTVHNSRGGINIGLNTTPPAGWTTEGVLGHALDLANGTLPSSADTTLDAFDFSSGETFAISIWFKSKSTTNPVATRYILSKQDNDIGYALYVNTSGQIEFGIDSTVNSEVTWSPDDTVTSTTDFYDNQWHHIVAVRDSSPSLLLYIDGELVASDTSLTATGSLNNNAAFILGNSTTSTTGVIEAYLDELQFYRGGLSPFQVTQLYNSYGFATDAGFTSTDSTGTVKDNSQARSYCVPYDSTTCNVPFAHWSFNENTGQTLNSISLLGSSTLSMSLGGSGSTESSDPIWSPGVSGSGLSFDGTDDYARTSADENDLDINDGENFTIELWFKRDTFTNTHFLVEKKAAVSTNNRPGYALWIDGTTDVLNFQLSETGTPPGSDYTVAGSTAITDTKWHHVAAVFDRSSTTASKIYLDGVDDTASRTGTLANINSLASNQPIYFGSLRNVSGYFDGSMDDVRLYRYARTSAQVAWSFNQGKPAAWWRLDECQGSVLNDAIGKGNNASITIGGSGSNTATGTCDTANTAHAWSNGKSGKFGSSLRFDGTDDVATVTNNRAINVIDEFTISAWIKTTTTPGSYVLFLGKGDLGLTGTTAEFGLLISQTGVPGAMYRNISYNMAGSTNIADGHWHHIAFVYSLANDTRTLYVDGVAEQTGTTSAVGATSSDSSDLRIGSGTIVGSNTFFNGQIDEVKIFNYPLSEEMIRNDYNSGILYFGPNEGQPNI